ncbi:sodium:solute symporter family protein [Cellulomonas carbonis]|uniref:Sodium:solute symporter n=1 Tax=Cellulomonas carbonis T26 TaxID=947969 RepID=A0A0A0BNT7_9CELL|nr:sodium:solute symporter family protein [Cellulomonas carbonis]KGM09610.1 sodium:solute symporter [Cellulomonas carbonis T26]GGB94849.1 sodium/solute symporter [Cellulomonas carbonis]
MSPVQLWTLVFVGVTFSLYIWIAYRSRVSTTSGFYVAGGGIPAPANGAAIAADWMSAASFISMAGLIAFGQNGYAGSVYLMGWTGGYVLLALLLAPYLRKFGKYTVPDFVGDRYSETARLVAVVCAITVSFVYVAGQMSGVGVVFQRFLGVGTTTGVLIGMVIVFFYAVLGGMKGITWTQVAQYSVLIVAYLIPAVAISLQLTGIPVPQVSFGQILAELNGLQEDLGIAAYTEAFTQTNMLNMVLITGALMFGTAGLPHVIVRFYTARNVRAARYSALWALFFISLLYTTAPAIGAFSKLNVLQQLSGTPVADVPSWYTSWSEVGLIAHDDANGDGVIDIGAAGSSELVINNDIVVLATPEIAGLPAPIVGLVAAGGLAAALSTASGLLLVISSSVANDVYFKRINPRATEARQLGVGRIAMAGAIVLAGYLGINPPGFVAQVVALAFGLAAASFFPVLVLGIFWKRCTAAGATAGMLAGLVTTLAYQLWTIDIYGNSAGILGIAETGFGTVGMIINFVVTILVSQVTEKPTPLMQQLVEDVRYPGRTQLVAAHASGEIEDDALHGEHHPHHRHADHHGGGEPDRAAPGEPRRAAREE